jgi:hypothetical protein
MDELRETYRIQGENALAVKREELKQQEMKSQADAEGKISELTNLVSTMYPDNDHETNRGIGAAMYSAGLRPHTVASPGNEPLVRRFASAARVSRRPTTGAAPQSVTTETTAPSGDVDLSAWDKDLEAATPNQYGAPSATPVPPRTLVNARQEGESYYPFSSVEPSQTGSGHTVKEGNVWTKFVVQSDQLSLDNQKLLESMQKSIMDSVEDVKNPNANNYTSLLKVFPMNARGKFDGVEPQEMSSARGAIISAMVHDLSMHPATAELEPGRPVAGFLDKPPYLNVLDKDRIKNNANELGAILAVLQSGRNDDEIFAAGKASPVRNSLLLRAGNLIFGQSPEKSGTASYEDLALKYESVLATLDVRVGDGTSELLLGLYTAQHGLPGRDGMPRNQYAKKVVESSRAAAQATQEQPAPTTAQGGETEGPLWAKVARRMGVSVEEAKRVVGDEQAPAPQQQTKLPEETQDTLRGQMFERAVSFMSPALEKDGLNTQDVVRIDKIPDRQAIRVFFKDGSSKYYYPK